MSVKFEVVESDIDFNTFRVFVKQQIPGPTCMHYGDKQRILKSPGVSQMALRHDLKLGAVVEVQGCHLVIDGKLNEKLHIREVATV